MRKLIYGHGFTIANLSSRLSEGGKQLNTNDDKSKDRRNAEGRTFADCRR